MLTNTRLGLITAVAVAVLAVPTASFASIKWTLNTTAPIQGYKVSDGTNAGVTINSVSGWAETGAAGDVGNKLSQEIINVFGGGLGVNIGGETSPNHSVDNSGPDEMILFQFSEAIALQQVSIGYFNTDSDITVLAYTGAGAPDLTQNTYSSSDGIGGTSVGLTNDGWDFIGHYNNLHQTGYQADVNPAMTSSSYWLVGAYNKKVYDAGWSSYNDFVKLKKLVGKKVPDQPEPPAGVPEPGTLGLLALGLPLLGRLRRRNT